jgi:DNA processing protein
MARVLCQELAHAGYTIVSGLARGTDTEAHCGALDVGGKTIAVMANNINEIYPPENEKLSLDIIKSGALLSESTVFKKLERSNFVLRNRITSGLSKCLVVIESGDTRGTMHQINIASEQHKPIFLLKPIEMNNAFTNDFIDFLKLGAIPFNSSNEILNKIQNNYNVILNKPIKKVATMTLEDFNNNYL